eukprot:gene6849-9376_t
MSRSRNIDYNAINSSMKNKNNGLMAPLQSISSSNSLSCNSLPSISRSVSSDRTNNTSYTQNTLPSLATSISRSSITNTFNDDDFMQSMPVFRRGRYAVFDSDNTEYKGVEIKRENTAEENLQNARQLAKKNIEQRYMLLNMKQKQLQKTVVLAPPKSSEELELELKKRRELHSGKRSANSQQTHKKLKHKNRKRNSMMADDYVVKQTNSTDYTKDSVASSSLLNEVQKEIKLRGEKRRNAVSESFLLPDDNNNNNNNDSNYEVRQQSPPLLSLNMKPTSIELETDEMLKISNKYEFFGEKSRNDFIDKFKHLKPSIESRYPTNTLSSPIHQKYIKSNKSQIIVNHDHDIHPLIKKKFGNLNISNDDDDLINGNFDLPSTPRSQYLIEITKNNLLPLPIILRKDTNPLGICLGSRGLGDDRVLPLIKIIDQLPAIKTVDLADNRLTDLSLVLLTNKLSNMKYLTYLDLSYNKIDKAAYTIDDFLQQDYCILRTLLLNGADIDDDECNQLARAISNNKSIKTLGLAKNLIGSNELLNVLNPDLVTGGEALGAMLRVNNTLTSLDLSWNSIRLESAVALALSLEVNSTLKTLLLAYNSLGDRPCQILGRTLKVNKSLTELDIESNSITPKAATVLANAISFNETLVSLNINGNVLGRIGAQALVAAIQRSSTDTRKLQVSFINCDCRKEDNIFSAANPHGIWKLNLGEPYGQMVAAECMYLANFRPGVRLDRLIYNGQQVMLERSYGDDKEAQAKKNKFKEFLSHCGTAADNLLKGAMADASKSLQILLDQFGFQMDEENRLMVLNKTLELWNLKVKREKRDDFHEVFLYEVFFALFVIHDADLSGSMELDEFLDTLALLGMKDFDRDVAKRLMAEHDRDESGSVDANEFGMIMMNEFCKTEMPKGELVEISTQMPWQIPPSGHCEIKLSYQSELPTMSNIGEDHGIDNIIQSIVDAKTDEQRDVLFHNTTSSPYFFLSFEQSQMLLEVMTDLNRIPLDIMATILPQIVNEEQTVKFLDNNLNDKGKLALRIKVGQLFNSYIGLYTGHYLIDLKNPQQQNGSRRLGAICISEAKECRENGANTSQKGNYSNFRNEKLGVQVVDITGRWFASNTSTKILHFDYISTRKPRKGIMPISDSKFNKFVYETLELPEIKKVYDRIRDRQIKFESQYLNDNGIFDYDLFEIYQNEKINDKKQGIHRLNTADRNSNVSTSDLSISSANSATTPTNTHHFRLLGNNNNHYQPLASVTQVTTAFSINPKEFPELCVESPLTVPFLQQNYAEYIETSHHYHDIYPEERMRDFSRPNYNPNERPPTPEDMRLAAPKPNRSIMHPIFALAFRRILELQISVPYMHLSINQLIIILEMLPPEICYLRVQVITSVFSRLVDMDNMYKVIDNVLTLDERNELFHRVGIMNVLDPMKPDRLYRLDLRRFDHREWVKILVALAIAEPGENWEQVEYRWGKYDDNVPGWTLPGTWTMPDDGGNNAGPRNHGWLRVSYRSYGNGCMPVMSVRRQLRKRTLAGIKRAVV